MKKSVPLHTPNKIDIFHPLLQAQLQECYAESFDFSTLSPETLHSYKLISQRYQKFTEESNQEIKASFLANMSHEIRTPMNAILGFSQLLTQSNLNEKQLKYANLIKNSSLTLIEIINDILDFSKLESGQVDLEFLETNPFTDFEETFLLLSEDAKAKNIAYHIFIDDSLETCLLLDSFHIKQIMINLIGNAIKFTPANGSIKISITNQNSSNTAQKIRFSVEDTGIGIPETRKTHIFEPFSQADSSTTREFGGTGLGLSISSNLVKMMGSTLELKSIVNQGSTFYFDIQYESCTNTNTLNKDLETIPIESNLTHEMQTLHLNILVAEDYDINRILITELLNQFHINFTFAFNGKEAVEMVQKNKYDLILMDINMPVMNGIDATKIILNDLQLDIPIVALTANALDGDKEKFLDLGMVDYLSKPIDIEAFQNLLLRYNNTKKEDTMENTKEKIVLDVTSALEEATQRMGLPAVVIEKIFSSFYDSIANIRINMNNAIATKAYKDIEMLSHNLKSSSATFSFEKLAQHAQEMETNAKNANEDFDFAALFSTIECYLDLIVQSRE